MARKVKKDGQRARAEKRYTIRDGRRRYSTGVTRDGFQALMVIFKKEHLAFLFEKDGTFLRVDRKETSHPLVKGITTPQEEAEFVQWKQDLGLVAGTITVKAFWLPEHDSGIRRLPEMSEYFLENPDVLTTEHERSSMYQSIKKWKENDKFVLRLGGEEHWFDKDGASCG